MIRQRVLAWSAFAFAAALLAVAAAGPARAELRIDITRGQVEPLPIAVLPFHPQGEEQRRFGLDVSNVVAADLERSGLFRPLDRRAFVTQEIAAGASPRFADWRVINANALVQGAVSTLPDGRLRVEFRLWDVFAEQQMAGFVYTTVPAGWRRVAHLIADAVYKRLTGEEGYFDTRIVYVAESGPKNQRVKRLAIMDQDGENHRFLSDGANLVLTPRFSPSLQEIAFLAFIRNRPRVYVMQVDTGRFDVLGSFPGMTFAPRFAPDGNRVIMSMAKDGNSEIYTMDMRTKAVQQLTVHSAIDTAPSLAPDASQIVFESDRGGTQQLYVMNADGSNVRRITFGQGRYGTPVWSPRGDLIAFTRQSGGRFSIGVMRPDGSGERQLADGFLVESPTWAPNGRVLMFTREEPSDAQGRGGRSRLFTIDLTGYNEREVITPLDASDPAWSPLNP